MKALVPTILIALTACSANRGPGADADTAGGANHTGESTDDSTPLDSVPDEPTWFALSGGVIVDEGSLTLGALQIAVYGADTEGEPLCEIDPTVGPMQVLESPDPLIFHWVGFDLEHQADCLGADQIPTTLRFGLGALYSELKPRVQQDGLGEVQDSLYGVYVAYGSLPEDSAWAFAYAGTEADRQGETAAVEAPPMPDGIYQITPAFLLELP